MTPEEIKAQIQAAYMQAIGNRNSQKYRSGNIGHLFRDVTLYGQDAGVDFVETHIGQIVHEAVETAECKSPALELTLHGVGLSARKGMAETLRKLTDLKIELTQSQLRMIWAEAQPGLI